MPNDIRDNIQNSGLSNLISENSLIQRAAANLTATIYIQRLNPEYNNKWGDFIANLNNNVKNDNLSIKKASITTIGFICEGLQKEKN